MGQLKFYHLLEEHDRILVVVIKLEKRRKKKYEGIVRWD